MVFFGVSEGLRGGTTGSPGKAGIWSSSVMQTINCCKKNYNQTTNYICSLIKRKDT